MGLLCKKGLILRCFHDLLQLNKTFHSGYCSKPFVNIPKISIKKILIFHINCKYYEILNYDV